MKAVRNILRVLAAALSVATLVMFFLPFASVTVSGGSSPISLTGVELVFKADVVSRAPVVAGVDKIMTGTSLWFVVALVFGIIAAVTSIMGFFKGKGFFASGLVFSLITGVTLLVLDLGRGAQYVDVGHITTYFTLIGAGVTMTLFALLSCILSFVAVVVAAAGILVNDRIEVVASKGAKRSIPARIARFFRDYKSEIKKIVWPTGRTVFKNTVSVIVMCLIFGALIWLVDWGLSELLKLIFSASGS